jgi:uncharacterized membrane protein YccC
LWQSTPGGGIINDLLTSSAAYCSRLAAVADRNANDGRRVASAEISAQPESAVPSNPETQRAIFERPSEQLNATHVAQQTRAHTVARLIRELDDLKPQMFEDEANTTRSVRKTLISSLSRLRKIGLTSNGRSLPSGGPLGKSDLPRN